MPGGEQTVRVDVLEARVDGFVKLFEERFKNIEKQLVGLASDVTWTKRTMIGILVATIIGFITLNIKG
ncbi:MAG: hemolysin XhlA family protein [Bacteroidales bacterium]|nr:hemolysin XhlA family protein [Bacteroidales bacterium]